MGVSIQGAVARRCGCVGERVSGSVGLGAASRPADASHGCGQGDVQGAGGWVADVVRDAGIVSLRQVHADRIRRLALGSGCQGGR